MNTAHFFWLLPLTLLACNDTTQPPAVTSPPQTEVVSEQEEHVADLVASLEVSNPSRFDRPDTLISFSLNELGVASGPLQVWKGETAQPSQLLDDDGDGNDDRLVFLTDLDAAAVEDFTIDRQTGAQNLTPRAHAEVSVKEGGEWQESKYVGGTFKNVPHVTNPPQYTDHSEYIRYEGPGIESNLVGYRVYLDWRNGLDIFGKKTPGLVLQDVGQDGYDSYHEMADWGADILKVGQSLGMGGYGFWDGAKTVLVSDAKERSATVRSDGPIHSSLDIDYKGWNTSKATVDMKATLSMQAGSPMVEVDLETSAPLDNLAIGIVAHPGTELIMGDLDITGEAWSYMASFGQQTLFEDDLGMVVLFRKKDLVEQTRDESSYVLIMKPRGTRLSYAFGALWSGQQGGVQSREELIDYLAAEVERHTIPPRIRLKTEASREVGSLDPLEVSTQLASSEIKRVGTRCVQAPAAGLTPPAS